MSKNSPPYVLNSIITRSPSYSIEELLRTKKQLKNELWRLVNGVGERDIILADLILDLELKSRGYYVK